MLGRENILFRNLNPNDIFSPGEAEEVQQSQGMQPMAQVRRAIHEDVSALP